MKTEVSKKTNHVPRWLEWVREIQALAQTGNTYALNDFQHQRYQRLMEISAEILAEHGNISPGDTLQLFSASKGYATPKVDVRAAVFRDGKILLVRERLDGGWCLPGGWADVGDLPSYSAERETFEEAGFIVKARSLIGIYDANRSVELELFHAYKLVFLCDLVEGSPTPSDETSEVGFFDLDNLPEPLSTNRTSYRHLRDAFAALHEPLRPAVFD